MSTTEALILSIQIINATPYLTLLIFLAFDFDCAYWLFNDFGPNPLYRSIQVQLLFLLIRAILLILVTFESIRAVLFVGMCTLFGAIRINNITVVLSHRAECEHNFFQWYSQLFIVFNIFGKSINTFMFLTFSMGYCFFIQSVSICILGWDRLPVSIYTVFVCAAFAIVLGILTFFPVIASIGENVNDLPKLKVKQALIRFRNWPNRSNKVFLKKAYSLKPLTFSYGNCCQLGKVFLRNLTDNGFQDLVSVTIILKPMW